MEYSRKPFSISVVTDNEKSFVQSARLALMGTSAFQGIAWTAFWVIGYKALNFIGGCVMNNITDMLKEKMEEAINTFVLKKAYDEWKSKHDSQLMDIEESDCLSFDEKPKIQEKRKMQTFETWKEEEKDDFTQWMKNEKNNIYKLIRGEKDKLAELERNKKEQFQQWINIERKDFDERMEQETTKLKAWEKQQRQSLSRWMTKVKNDIDEWEKKEKNDMDDWKIEEKKKVDKWITNAKTKITALTEDHS